jgi:cell wall-associated NlpC family hydrolase
MHHVARLAGGGLALCLTLAAAATPASSATVTAANWDAAQQRQVVREGLMSNLASGFQGAAALSAAQANGALGALATRLAQASPASAVQVPRGSRGPVSMVAFDAMMVRELGLGEVASRVQATAAAAGLRPPFYFGSEVAARLLELRYEQPIGHEALDLFPYEAITRAEAAWSLARVLGMGEWNLTYVRETLAGFALPHMSGDQLQALRIAVSRVGYPYVWGGTTDDTADGLAHGGYDCSGFVWRVFKVSGLPWGQQIRGRTAAEQAGEIPRSQRLRIGQLAPGDLLFFGSARLNSTATERNVVHEGIYLGDNWVIHSSSQGVYVLPLRGSWLGSSFVWGRRVIG